MNILHVISTMDPAAGGPPAVAARLAAAQAASGGVQHVQVTSHFTPGREQQVRLSVAEIPGISRVQFTCLAPELRLGFFLPRVSRLQLQDQVARTNIVHLHGVWDPILLAAARLARRQGVPYVITPHGMLDPWSLQQSRMKKKIALALAYRRMLQNAAAFHVLNDDEARLMEPLRLQPPKRVIPNGVFLEEIEPLPEPGTFHVKHQALNGQPYVLFLSRLHFKKGLDYLADAFAIVARAMPNVHLVVAGPDGGAQADFEQRIAASGLVDRVHLTGPILGREKFAAIVDAACFCLPSRQEGFSMAITEALACGTPVVISRECHFPEVADVGAGEVVELSANHVAEALLRMLRDGDRRGRMADAGRLLVRTRYTWPAIANQCLEMYRVAIKQALRTGGGRA